MTVIIFILLSSIKISTSHGWESSKECIPSRCGDQEISYPFTLKGHHPSNCGDQKYQLLCIGNKTFLGAPYDRYLVTNISYDNYRMNIVHSELASGKCNLPSVAITPSFFPQGFRLLDECNFLSECNYVLWVAFMNCSEKIDEAIIPCLSQNNRFIHLVGDGRISALAVSCSYLTMVPINRRVDVYDINIGDNFGISKHGFSISWATKKIPRSILIHHCLAEAVLIARNVTVDPIKIDWIQFPIPNSYLVWIRFPFPKYPFLIADKFVDCIGRAGDEALYRYSIACSVLLHIISFGLVIITLGRLMAPLCIHVFLIYKLLKMLSPIDYIEIFLRNQQRTTLTRYVYTDIVAITNHFKDRLGQGGFGTVYKGELPGDYLVAVKLLGKSNDNGEDFISEVSTIGMIHHTNVVRLIGFCSEGLHRALVYEYMYNGSLDKYIFSSTKKFTTKKLNEIALGVARGIDYLHQGCDMRILHFDIKPHNILLDSNFNPKVSDFGLAKLYSKDNSLVSTFAARGTIGYMAPELISRSFGLISYKSDVYSFGMLLLEMAGGRRNYDPRVEISSQTYYPSWIYNQLNQQTNLNVLDHEVEVKIADTEKKLCKIGLWCIQMSPSSRPTMSRIVEMLENDIDDVEMPPRPFFYSSSQHTTRGQNSFQMSSNEISTVYENE